MYYVINVIRSCMVLAIFILIVHQHDVTQFVVKYVVQMTPHSLFHVLQPSCSVIMDAVVSVSNVVFQLLVSLLPCHFLLVRVQTPG